MIRRLQAKAGKLRIIGGRFRGRRLPILDIPGLRPTPDRVRETLFNWLMPYIRNAHCLDLFAGTGALGFEALSRGAATVVMVEQDPNVIGQLHANKQVLEAAAVDIWPADARQPLRMAVRQFDIVFIDPPFRQQMVQPIIDWLQQGWLANGAMIYIESERELTNLAIGSDWLLHRQAFAGQVCFRLYQVQ